MWINGLGSLHKPLLIYTHTQFNKDIPCLAIDMDFMNLNQSAHGDREFGFILAKMGINRKIVVGHWEDFPVQDKIGIWSRVALGKNEMQHLEIARFGDNMRQVAVTEGNKVLAQEKFGMEINAFALGDFVKVISQIADSVIQNLINEYEDTYQMMDSLKSNGKMRGSLVEEARIELGLKSLLKEGGFGAYSNKFEDLHGLRQLSDVGSQRMMAAGYGGEGDWKTSGMLRVLKVMATGLKGGKSLMKGYTYHFDPTNPMVLGSHMLEICPSIAAAKVHLVHPLGIGRKEDPVRLIFNGAAGKALNVSLIDLENRFRLLANEVEVVGGKRKIF